MRRSTEGGLAFALAALMVAGTWTAVSGRANAGSPDDLQAAKAASARYHSIQQAKADGYVASPECVVSPDGVMGYHFVKPSLMGDPAINATQPEILLYVRDAKGKWRLVGLEYLRFAADQEPPIDPSDKPSLFGQAFDGPMPGHEPGMPHHYDLHVWLWADNPSGMFAPFNPTLTCG